MVQEIYWKMHHASCTNNHHDVTNLVKYRMVKNTKTWITQERIIIFLSNKKILNLCLRWHILRNYCFVAEVTFNLHFICLQNIYCEYLIFLTDRPDLKLSFTFFFLFVVSKIFRNSFQFKECEMILGMLKNYTLVSRHFPQVFQGSAWLLKVISAYY